MNTKYRVETIIDVSLDIETYSLNIPDAAIISIACCTHDANFEMYLNRQEQEKLDRHFDIETIEWHQVEHPIWYNIAGKFTSPNKGIYVRDALLELCHWFTKYVYGNAESTINLWMKPPKFDSAIINHLAKQMKIELPWDRHDERDLYTLQAMAKARNAYEYDHLPSPPDNAHDALVDAKYQLEIINRCKEILKL